MLVSISLTWKHITVKTYMDSSHPSVVSLLHLFSKAGRSSKRQLFLLPGGIERHLKIKTCSVSILYKIKTCSVSILYKIKTCSVSILYKIKTCSVSILHKIKTCSVSILYKIKTYSVSILYKIKTCSVSILYKIQRERQRDREREELLSLDLTDLYHTCSFLAQVAQDAIEELCYEMGLNKLTAMDEYAIFVVVNRGVMLVWSQSF